MSSYASKFMLGLCLLGLGLPGLANAQQASDQPPALGIQQGAPIAKPPEQQPKAPPKPHKRVITNDDLEGKGAGLYAQMAGVDLRRINECDRYCYEQVRQMSRIAPGPDMQWKRDLLSGIDKVAADAVWQARLEGIARVKGAYCLLQQGKNAELAERADPRNVTKTELDIEDKYERKFQAEQGALISVYDQAEAVRMQYRGIVVQFMQLQEQRISNAPCAPPQAPYDPEYGEDP
jgi:hypothetical protein